MQAVHSCEMVNKVTSMDLEDFIRNKMKMSHIYQPVMLKVLLESGGEATVDNRLSCLLLVFLMLFLFDCVVVGNLFELL